ncbi:hypothetical protein J2I47_05630 [Fibrella sp. HMF5335]|uniref:Uncharacterized protein n=1 Tax=Fibrella rubiginis TaxID=2817060 RepID=A0A939GFZ3_9BACT|nr:hypothetical protein [Fibrella rubiginis]MBO0936021.1 hypothetical protein [Fibrella rubiginis]
MKHTLLLLPTLFWVNSSFGQMTMNSSGTYNTLTIQDPYQNNYVGVEGSPYMPEKGFAPGWIKVRTGKQPMQGRFNTQLGQLEFIDGQRVQRLITPTSEFGLIPSPGDTLLFRNGFSGKGEITPTTFCQVLFYGKKAALLAYLSGVIKKDEDPMSNDFGKKQFVQKKQVYLLINNDLQAVMPTKSSLISAFPADQRDGLGETIKRYGGKLKSWTEVKLVLQAYDNQ